MYNSLVALLLGFSSAEVSTNTYVRNLNEEVVCVYTGACFDPSFQARASCLEVCISVCSNSLGIIFGVDICFCPNIFILCLRMYVLVSRLEIPR